MSDVLLLLQLEHQWMAKLLRLIERQAANLARRMPVNHRLLGTALEYASTYPDQCHHPKEDLVYRKLVGRDPGMAAALGDFLGEHERLGRLTREVTQAARSLQEGGSPTGPELAVQLDDFVNRYRRHILMEDQHFFPAASEALTPQDLDEIDFALFDAPDPLIDPDSPTRFGELHDEITRLGVAEGMADHRGAELELLATLRDAATFNAMMERIGESIRLAPASPEGYDLQDAERVLTHIPACDESRAAWCAYFYWKAKAAVRR